MLNSVILIGRITHDLSIQTSASGVQYLNFSLAITRRNKKDQTDFINCTAFGKTAEVIAKYLSKGSPINIEGSIQSSTFVNKEGNKVTRLSVIVDRMNFIPSSNNANAGNNNFTPKQQPTESTGTTETTTEDVSSNANSKLEENELRDLFDDMDFFNDK